LLAAVERVTPPAALSGLFEDVHAGDIRALRMLLEIFDRAEQRALRESGDRPESFDKQTEIVGTGRRRPTNGEDDHGAGLPKPDLFSASSASSRATDPGRQIAEPADTPGAMVGPATAP
jgi:hypothetical protein